MRTHYVHPTDSLTWDDVCQLWDDGFYSTEDVKRIATLYFDDAELTAVLEVIENVDNDSPLLVTINIAPGDDMGIVIGAFDCLEFECLELEYLEFECLEFENVHILMEPDCDHPRRVLH
jgi:hypothetical protein